MSSNDTTENIEDIATVWSITEEAPFFSDTAPLATRLFSDGAEARFWVDEIDGAAHPIITVGNLTTDNAADWGAIETYIPRREWPEQIWAGKRGAGLGAHTDVDPLLVELIEAAQDEIWGWNDAEEDEG